MGQTTSMSRELPDLERLVIRRRDHVPAYGSPQPRSDGAWGGGCGGPRWARRGRTGPWRRDVVVGWTMRDRPRRTLPGWGTCRGEGSMPRELEEPRRIVRRLWRA